MAIAGTPSSISFLSSSIFISSPNPNPQKLHFLKKSCPTVPSTTALSLSVRSELSTTTIATTTLPILSPDGTPTGSTTTLTLKSAPPSTARAVVHRGITTDLTNRRRGTASTLTRAEVSGGGSKPYPQKKTGRARRGSQRTPLRPGGGVIFGPKPKDWSVKINKKEKRLAISTALASAAKDNVIVVEDFDGVFQDKPKTKEFVAMMGRLGLDAKKKSVFLMNEVSENVLLSGRNIGTVKMLTPRTLNLFDVLDADNLVLTSGAVEFLNERYGVDDGEFDDDYEVEDDGGDDEGVDEAGDSESSSA